MNLTIPFTKDIKFSSNISEILSISLEHEYTVNESGVLGNFIVSGEYKTHEVSVNKENFEKVLPFSVDLTNKIDTDSLDFAIEDFTYELIDKNTLKVNIEYSIKANPLKEEVFESVEDANETLEDMLDNIDLEEKEERNDEVIEEKMEEKEDIEEQRDTVSEEEKETVINSTLEKEESFITYNIHIMQSNDTIDSICAKYNTNTSILEEYNDISKVSVGDKIIIPEINE